MNANPASAMEEASVQTLINYFNQVRSLTESLCEPLVTEDYVIAPTAHIGSPIRWHLAHTSWFFETMLLVPYVKGYKEFHPQYNFFFNSYYVQLGDKQDRTQRAFVSRPTVSEVYEYRKYVTDHMLQLMDNLDESQWTELEPIITIGIHHEQQHQELMVTDIKHIFWNNPLRPVYKAKESVPEAEAFPLDWHRFDAGNYWIGHDGSGFAYDNEGGRHQQYVGDFELGSRLVTNGEFIEFIEDRGYENAKLWLDAGWDTLQDQGWSKPFFWEKRDDGWWQMTMNGMQPVNKAEPVSHVSYFEADAYARWAGVRLPTEAEWEIASQGVPMRGNFVESGLLEPTAATSSGLSQLFGDVWEWTQSHYSPYPGYEAPPGALGEYNGKFMCGSFVLRGGSCATSITHIRPTYRNFFAPHVRWQYSGIRLARSL